MKCPYCNEEINRIATHYEVYDGDGDLLKEMLDDALTDIVKGRKEMTHYESFECPHCKAYLSIEIPMTIGDVKIELESEPDEEEDEDDD